MSYAGIIGSNNEAAQVVHVTQAESGGTPGFHNPIIIRDNPPNPDRVTGDSEDALAIALSELQSSHIHPAFIGRYGSGAAVEVVRDIELDGSGTEVIATPIEDALGHRYTRYGRKARRNSAGLIFHSEHGRVWQVKHSIGLPPESPQITSCDLTDRPPSETTQGYIADRIMSCQSHEDAAIIAESWGRSLEAIWEAIKSKVSKESKLSPESLKRYRARYRDASGLDMRAAFIRFCDYLREPGGFKAPKRSGEYRAPKDIGNAIYTPPIPAAVLGIICDRHGLDFAQTASDIEAAGGFWPWVAAGDLPLVITEGGKKALAALSQGYIAIGVYGCSCAKSPELSPFVEGEKSRKITIAFDQDVTYRARLAVVQGVRSAKNHWWDVSLAEFAIASWDGSQGKGLDDLPTDVMVQALDRPQSYHSWRRSNARNKIHREMLHDLTAGYGSEGIAPLSPALKWHHDRVYGLKDAPVGYFDPLEINPAGLKDAPVGYFDPLEVNPAGDRAMTVLLGQVKTGKTSTALRSAIDTAKATGLSTLYVCPTQNLARSAAAELDCTPHTDESRAGNAYHLTVCPESLGKFSAAPDGSHWDVMLWDEANESVDRLLRGNLGRTPQKSRDAAIATLSQARWVIVGSEDLNAPTLSTLTRWGGFGPDQIQWHQRRRPQTDIKVRWYQDGACDMDDRYDPDRKSDEPSEMLPQRLQYLGEILKALEDGQRVVLSTGSRKFGRQVSRLVRAMLPGKKVIVVDGRDTPSKRRGALADRPDGFIADNQPDLFIFTPTINSGVSFSDDYFDVAFEYVTTFETASSGWQRGARIRPSLGGGKIKERHVYLQQTGLGTPQPEVFSPDYWRDALIRRAHCTDAKLSASIGRLLEGTGVVSGVIATIANGIGSAADISAPELPEIMALTAIEVYHKREILGAKFEDAGWNFETVESVEWRDADGLAGDSLPGCCGTFEELKNAFEVSTISIDIRRASTLARACSLAVGAIRKPKQLRAWSASMDIKGPVQAAQFQRWDVEQDFMGKSPLLELSHWWESWLEDGSPWLHRAKIWAALHMSEDAIAFACQWHALNRLASVTPGMPKPDGKPPLSLSDLSYIELLRSCPHLTGFLSGRVGSDFEVKTGGATVRAYSKDSPEVQAVAAWCRKHERDLACFTQHARLLKGFQFTVNTPDVKCVHKLLESLGALSRCVERKGGRSLYALKEIPQEIPSPPELSPAKGKGDNVQLRLAAVSDEIEAIATGAGFSADSVTTFEYNSILAKVVTYSAEPTPVNGWKPTHTVLRDVGLRAIECMVMAVEKAESGGRKLWRCIDAHGYVFDVGKQDLTPLPAVCI